MGVQVESLTRSCFAAGGAAVGLISNGVSFFLLLFYSQVVGLSPALTGLALFIALMVDAVSDPVLGRWSDNFQSRMGRRHPFLYASLLPIAGFYYALWVPPALDETGLFFYLLLNSIGLRLGLTAYGVPFAALVPELTRDYDQRTRLINYNISSSWLAGTLIAIAMYAYWLADTPEFPDGSGILRVDGYAEAGLATSVIVLFLLAFSVIGTHRHIPQLPRAAANQGGGLMAMLRQIRETFAEPSFRAIAMSGIFSAAGSGTATALWAYMQPYYWGFNSEQTSLLLSSQLFSALLAFGAIGWLSHGREKKQLLILLSWALIIVSSGPVALREAGMFPANGSDLLFTTMLVLGVIQVALIIAASIIGGSMLSDLVETREAISGAREEGTLLAIQSFISKVATGAGTFLGGAMLTLAGFPEQTQVADVSAATITKLGLLYGPALGILYVVAIYVLKNYSISRASHAEAVANLSQSEDTRA
jgi:Na+/melibiose symporter-like transporter